MKRFLLSCVAMLLFFTLKAVAQDDYNARAKKYVAQYAPLAIAEQRDNGIPACITLGQGILETEAGNSELMVMANNHFGIKCKNGWQGETFLHTDDAKDECFKKYSCAEDSYKDHSNHLKINPRYSSLFSLSLTDYTGWARGLKRCGYATDPQYATRLINIIEEFGLQQYTYAAMDSSKSIVEMKVSQQQTPDPPNPQLVDVHTDTTRWVPDLKKSDNGQTLNAAAIIDTTKRVPLSTDTVAASAMQSITSAQTDVDSTTVTKVNGLKAFYAHKGDMLLQYAMKYNVRYAKLLEINDMADGPVPDDAYIYLEKKLSAGANAQHTVAAGESLWSIAQKEGIQLKRLTALNLLSPDDVPAPGAILHLQFPASKKPAVVFVPSTAHKDNAIIIINSDDKAAANRDSDYIALKNPEEAFAENDSSNVHVTADTTFSKKSPAHTIKSTGFPKPRPATAAAQALPPIVVITTKAPTDKNAPVQWVKNDTAVPVKTAAPTEDEQEAKQQELASLKAQLDKVVYADDSKLVAAAQSVPQAPVQKLQDEKSVSKAGKYYTVKKGDTAFSIARRNNITVNQLYKWNDIDASDIKVGKKLKVENKN